MIQIEQHPAPARLRHHDGEPCIVCGRKLDDARCQFVHGVVGGYVPVDDTTDYGAADLGWFGIGPECAKTIPAEYRR